LTTEAELRTDVRDYVVVLGVQRDLRRNLVDVIVEKEELRVEDATGNGSRWSSVGRGLSLLSVLVRQCDR
jgi:hypothetical protein